MIALPLSVLALAAGVYLLMKATREYLGGLYKFFAWLVILLSIVSVVASVRHGIHQFRHHGNCEQGQCEKDKQCSEAQGGKHCEMGANGGACPMGGNSGACTMGANSGACPMGACKMQGDSVVLDRAVCEKMMGKDACEKLCKERGQCIMTKDECAKMCSAGGGMDCCKKGDMKECTKGMGEQKEMKECCKKK